MEDSERKDTVGDLPSGSGYGGSGNNRRQGDRSSSSSEGLSLASSSRATTVEPSGPSQIEILQYFIGIASGPTGPPKLVARSSEEPFVVKWDGTFQARKSIFPVGPHPICKTYPRMEIRKEIQHLPWVTVDIVRIGYSDIVRENPIVVLITVETGKVLYSIGQAAVTKCRQILLNRNLDVHVEMKEGEKLVSLVGRGIDSNTVPEYEKIPLIGQSIGPHVAGTNQASGTLGLYLTIKGRDSSLTRCALTCHHVVFPSGIRDSPSGPNQPFIGSSHPMSFAMDQPSTQDHNIFQDRHVEARRFNKAQIDILTERQAHGLQRIANPLTEKQLENLKNHKSKIEEIDKALTDEAQFPRAFGRVLFSSGITTDPRHGNVVDWALIALNMNRFDQRPENIVPEFDFRMKEFNSINQKLHGEDFFNPTLDRHLKTHVTLEEALNPSTLDTDGFPTFRVLKHGRTTGWTWGAGNQIRSDCSRTGVIYTEWCILGAETPFDKSGDSGSIVFDHKGRIAGFLHGSGHPESAGGAQITYVTPIEWLFENIEKTLGVTVILD